MKTPIIRPAQRRILDLLKRGDATTAGEIAAALRLTDVGVRQHLTSLEQLGLVLSALNAPAGRGRPAAAWSLTDLGQRTYPDHHAELTVDLIDATREAVGEGGLQKVIEARARKQVAGYRDRLPPPTASLKRRVEALATERTREGYMAEVVAEGRGRFLLIEHHCPICDAAKRCLGLCASELEVFRGALGRSVTVDRIAHLLSGEERCVYRIARA